MGAKPELKRVNIDNQSQDVQALIHSLPISREGCVLVIHGKPLFKVIPNPEVELDRVELREAIIARRDESRRLNQEWEAADMELWQKVEEMERTGRQKLGETERRRQR
jgi:hypothetical protein